MIVRSGSWFDTEILKDNVCTSVYEKQAGKFCCDWGHQSTDCKGPEATGGSSGTTGLGDGKVEVPLLDRKFFMTNLITTKRIKNHCKWGFVTFCWNP